MNPDALFYKPSQQVKPVGLIAAYLIGLVLTSLLAYLYTLIIMFIPLIYVNFLVTIGFGLALGIMVRILTRLTHNRSLRHQLLLAIILGLWANYCQWVCFLLYAVLGAMPDVGNYLINLDFIAEPGAFFGLMGEINQIGMWEVFGLPFNGWLLALVWLIEFAIIAAFPVIGVFKAKSIPYAEDLQTWYPKHELDTDFESIINPGRFVESLREDPQTAIAQLEPGMAWKYCKIHLHYLPEATHQYLSVERVFIEERGQGSKDSDVIIENFRLDRETAKAILDAYPHTVDRWEW